MNEDDRFLELCEAEEANTPDNSREIRLIGFSAQLQHYYETR